MTRPQPAAKNARSVFVDVMEPGRARSSVQNTPASDGPIYRPTISRRPSASIAAAMGVASGTMRPPSRTLRSVASKPETGPSA